MCRGRCTKVSKKPKQKKAQASSGSSTKVSTKRTSSKSSGSKPSDRIKSPPTTRERHTPRERRKTLRMAEGDAFGTKTLSDVAVISHSASEGADVDEDILLSVQEEPTVDDVVNEWLERMLYKGVKGLCEEFFAIRKTKPSKKNISAFLANEESGRNRYRNVVCLNETRVKLINHPSGNDYIHANYVATPFSKHRFICTQAPVNNTIYDFWFMVVQEKVQYIVMLTDFVENGYIKSTTYFPLTDNNTATYGGATIKCLKCKRRMDFDCEVWERTFLVTLEDKRPITVKHLHWVDWPDHGVPQSYTCPLHLLESIRMTTVPIVIHCSAGIGRTGCLVLIEFILEKLQYKQTCSNTNLILAELRRQRADIVQNDLQYLYVHRTLLQYFIIARRAEETKEVAEFIQAYENYMNFIPDSERTTSKSLSTLSQ